MNNKANGYYDVDFDIEKVIDEYGTLEELFYLQDLKQRKMFISDDITQYNIQQIVRHILQYNREDMDTDPNFRTPIMLYITSNGGSVDAGFELIDVIMSSKTPVYTVNLGYQYSMGFLIGLAGHRRYAMHHAKFLMHDGSNFIYNSGAKAQDQMEFNKKLEERIKDYVLSRTNITSEMYDSQIRKEWYMFANEAKELGVTDYIIGEDYPINHIV